MGKQRSTSETTPAKGNNTNSPNIQMILLSQIKVDENQPRSEFDDGKLKELKDSINANGLIHPITVKETGTNRYKIITGERRYEACKLLKLGKIPCMIRESEDEAKIFAMQIAENISREDLSPIDRAHSILKYRKIKGEDTEWKYIEKELGISETRRKQFIRLLNLPEEIQKSIVANKQRNKKTHITEAHARSLFIFDGDKRIQQALYNRIVNRKLNHREAMDEARLFFNRTKRSAKKAIAVEVNLNIEYKSRDDLIEKLRDYANTLKNGGVVAKKSSGTKIEWTTETWNPTTGCKWKSKGCDNCYAKKMALRLQRMGQIDYRNGFKFTYQPHRLLEPIHWKNPVMIFVNSMSDIFYDDMNFDYVDKIMNTINKAPWHVYQLLTKRADKMVDYFKNGGVLPQNAWMGVTVENDETKSRIAKLRKVKAGVRFISFEPLVGDVGKLNLKGIHWAIVGGESGTQARPMEKEWVINIKEQCKEQGVPFFFKQWGVHNEEGVKVGKEKAGSELDGIKYKEYPEVLKDTLIV